MSQQYESHEYAQLFPMMTAVELEALTADVKELGLRHPIVRYRGKILDGRNRLKACEAAGVAPTFSDYDGDDAGALALVISLNVQRRDLTAAQRAIAAAKALPQYEAIHKHGGDRRKQVGKSSPLGRSRDDAAKTFKVSDKSVQQAKALLAEAPDLAEQVESCTLSLADAYGQLQNARTERDRKRQEAERKARESEKNAQYREAVSNGEMTIDEALEKAREEAREEDEKARYDAEARSLWDGRMQQMVAILRESVAQRTDEHLAWYTEPGAPGSDALRTGLSDVDEAIALLRRVRVSTFHAEG